MKKLSLASLILSIPLVFCNSEENSLKPGLMNVQENLSRNVCEYLPNKKDFVFVYYSEQVFPSRILKENIYENQMHLLDIKKARLYCLVDSVGETSAFEKDLKKDSLEFVSFSPVAEENFEVLFIRDCNDNDKKISEAFFKKFDDIYHEYRILIRKKRFFGKSVSI